MSAMASQITVVSNISSNVCSGADQRKPQSSASLAFVRGIHLWSVHSPHKGRVTRKMALFHDVIMWCDWNWWLLPKKIWNYIFYSTWLRWRLLTLRSDTYLKRKKKKLIIDSISTSLWNKSRKSRRCEYFCILISHDKRLNKESSFRYTVTQISWIWHHYDEIYEDLFNKILIDIHRCTCTWCMQW